jgi:hypothetical protein
MASRSRVYLLWAILLIVGYIATHFYQVRQVNGLWFLFSIIGMGYMWHVMPMKVRQMRRIFLSWLVPIALGMTLSGMIFIVRHPAAYWAIAHLGVIWLIIMAWGYVWNGYVDKPMAWYLFAAGIHVAAAVVCLLYTPALQLQYILSAVVGGWAMLYLWIFRT